MGIPQTVEKVVEVPQIEHVQGETKHVHLPTQGARQAHPAEVVHVQEEGIPHPAEVQSVFAAPPATTVVAQPQPVTTVQPVTTGSVTVAPTTVQAAPVTYAAAPTSSVVVPQTYAAAPATYAAAPM